MVVASPCAQTPLGGKMPGVPLWDPDSYVRALNFASAAHAEQLLKGSREPYLRHVTTVAAEVMAAISARGGIEQADLAVSCALLHDTVEDTGCTLEELRSTFGGAVAEGVAALTKNAALPDKPARMRDSLDRIRLQPPAVWMVKLADRITNLQPPPAHWDRAKIAHYREEAKSIHAALHTACPVLGPRLQSKIERYG